MMAIFSDLVENIMEVFMDDFLVYGKSFEECFENFDKVLNWEKCHFMVREVSEKGIEVDRANIEVIQQLPPPTNVKGV
jgi:hypothetical protein